MNSSQNLILPIVNLPINVVVVVQIHVFFEAILKR